jgi:hypothetical protein
MLSAAMHYKATAGGIRAAARIEPNPALCHSTAEIINQESGLREILGFCRKGV